MRTRTVEISYLVLALAMLGGREPEMPALGFLIHGQALFSAKYALSGHDPATTGQVAKDFVVRHGVGTGEAGERRQSGCNKSEF